MTSLPYRTTSSGVRTWAAKPAALLTGNDVLLTNVLSFDVRILIPRDHVNRMIQYYNSTLPPNPPPV